MVGGASYGNLRSLQSHNAVYVRTNTPYPRSRLYTATSMSDNPRSEAENPLRPLLVTMIIPPGVQHDKPLVEVHAGGEGDWMPYSKTKLFTNAFIKQEGKVLR